MRFQIKWISWMPERRDPKLEIRSFRNFEPSSGSFRVP